jgi:ATP-dependent DNA helicase PIF1
LTYLETGKLISFEDKHRCLQLSKTEIDTELDTLLSNIQTAKTFSLKKGAVVMCTTNLCVEEGICNGSQGIVVDFVDSPVRDLSCNATMLVPLVRFTNGKTMRIAPFHRQSEEYPCLSVSQIPLCLAWALTIHKIQGATLQIADIDIGKTIFEYGQTYVALSRIKTLDGLYLSEFYPHRIKANPTVIAFYDSFPKVSPEQMKTIVNQSETEEVVVVETPKPLSYQTGIKVIRV